MAAVTELVSGVLEEAGGLGLGLGAPGVALVALVGAAVVGAPRARPLAKGAIRSYLSARDRASGGASAVKDRASEGAGSMKDRATGGVGAVKDRATGRVLAVVGLATGGVLSVRERATGWVAEIREGLEDTYAEAKHEYLAERAADLDLVLPGELRPATAAEKLILPGSPEAEATLAQADELAPRTLRLAAEDAPQPAAADAPGPAAESPRRPRRERPPTTESSAPEA